MPSRLYLAFLMQTVCAVETPDVVEARVEEAKLDSDTDFIELTHMVQEPEVEPHPVLPNMQVATGDFKDKFAPMKIKYEHIQAIRELHEGETAS